MKRIEISRDILMKKRDTQKKIEQISYKCPLCKDKGIILRDNLAYRCSCMKQKAWQKRLQSAHLTPQLSRYSFENFELKFYSRTLNDNLTGTTYYESARRCLEAAKRFAKTYTKQTHGRGLFIFGPVGSGKTFLAAAIANFLTSFGRNVLFTVVPDLLDAIRSTYDRRTQNSNHTELELIDTARKVDFLILDDLGAHNYTEWTCNKIYSLINYRLINELPTVITSNLKLDELAEYLGERTTSRLVQLCQSYHLPVDEDIRYVISRKGIT
ncbi:MAG: replication protein DnaC [Clostridia bacterium]|nr:replication protein DnaC [Clostridia bacterium]